MQKFLRYFYFLIFLIFVIIFVCSCGEQEQITDLKYFKFIEYFDEKIYTYEVKVDNGIYTYINKNGNNNIERELSKEEIDLFYRFLDKSKLINFNGFNEESEENLKEGWDEGGFTLDVIYGDDKEIHASGYNKYPKGYENFKERFLCVLYSYTSNSLE